MRPSLAREEEDGVDCYIEILGAKVVRVTQLKLSRDLVARVLKSSFLDGQKLQATDVILASEGFLDIIDSRILKFPSMNCAKVKWRGLDASHQGQKYDRKVPVAYLLTH